MANTSSLLLRLIPATLTASSLLAAGPIAPGPFSADLETFKQYQVPDWFRDAKFGIWSHWGPQAVPMEGDWYARNMYIPGQRQYAHHLATYGHPSTNGWKDIIPLWKAERFDPDRLMALYKQAGARYFVSMGVHHDNFDLWNSKHQRWNAVNMGPHKDIVGAWQKAARKQGLKFGVSEHLGASFWWWQVNKKADADGPFKGVPYDGVNTAFQDLYHWPAEPGDTGTWYSSNARWQAAWSGRIQDLVNNYKPDLLYTDGGLPFGNEVGASLVAHYYNADPKRKATRNQVVYTCKQRSNGRWVEDLERGVMAGINPDPWQTDTSIGDWFYNKHWQFRPVNWTIHMLVDIVSKNGNLLLNVVQRPDGSLDEQVERDLAALAGWIKVNGEGIYETRPWLVHGEGPVRARGGHFKEDFAYSARDLRFTAKGDNTLFVFALGWPDNGRIDVRSLANGEGVTGRIKQVSLLGHRGKLDWTQDGDGLHVRVPAERPCDYAVALKITGSQLRGFKPAEVLATVVEPDAAGALVLGPEAAELHGNLKPENQGGQPNLGFWDSGSDWASWQVRVKAPGQYRLTASLATVHEGPEFVFEIAGKQMKGRAPSTGAWDKFTAVDLGVVSLDQAGVLNASLKPSDPAQWKAVNLRWVKLEP